MITYQQSFGFRKYKLETIKLNSLSVAAIKIAFWVGGFLPPEAHQHCRHQQWVPHGDETARVMSSNTAAF